MNKDDNHNKELIAIIQQEGFGLDWQDIEEHMQPSGSIPWTELLC